MKYLIATIMFFYSLSSFASQSEQNLINAIKDGNIKYFNQIVIDGVDVNSRHGNGATILHWAAHHDELEIATLLVESGADINITDDNGATPLWIATYNSNYDMASMLLNADADPNKQLETGETPLMTASEIGDIKIVNALLDANADTSVREKYNGQTALMWAVAENHAGVAKALIDSGSNINSKSNGGFTPMHFASQNNSFDSVKVLLSMDADINAMSPEKWSPLLLAAASGSNELTKYLLEMGADPGVTDYKGFSPLHYAAMKRNMLESVRSLLEKGADPNVQIKYTSANHELQPIPDLPFLESPTRIVVAGTKSGTFPIGATPLYLAAQQRNAAAMKILAEYGADSSLRSTETVFFLGGSGRRVNYIASNTPLMVAAGMDRVANNFWEYPQEYENQAFEAVKAAIEIDSDINATNEYGMTALHAATFINADDIVEILIKNGADPDVKDKFGQTPVSISRHVITAGLGNYFDVRPRRASPSTFALLMKLGATPLEESGVIVRN